MASLKKFFSPPAALEAQRSQRESIALSRIGEIRILLKQLTLRVTETSLTCAGGAGVWPEFGSLGILVTIMSAFLSVLCVSNDPVPTGEWVVKYIFLIFNALDSSIDLMTPR
mgnify:CR=1 FL=1